MPLFTARVHTSFKPEYRPGAESRKLLSDLRSIGFTEVTEVVRGKLIELELEAEDQDAAVNAVRVMCDQLLANRTSEQFAFSVAKIVEPDAAAEKEFDPFEGMTPPHYREGADGIHRLDLTPCDLRIGPIKWTEAKWKYGGDWPTFVILTYSIYGREMPYPIRMDLDKGCLLDEIDYRGHGMLTQQIYDMRDQWNANIYEIENTRRIRDHIALGLQKRVSNQSKGV